MPIHRPIKFEKTLEPSIIKEIEEIVRKNPKAKTILNATLAIIALGGILTIGALAPGLAGEIVKAQKQRKKQSYDDYQKIWHSFNSLKKQKDLQFVREKGDYLVYRLTKKGREKIKKLILNEFIIKKPTKWDKK